MYLTDNFVPSGLRNLVKNLPPDTSHLSVNDAPSENGPTTDDSCSPDSALKIVTLSGGTEIE